MKFFYRITFQALIFLFLFLPALFAAENDDKVYEQLNVFGEAFDKINEMYVEDVDVERLIQSAINGMLNSLDPHSGFLPQEVMKICKLILRDLFWRDLYRGYHGRGLRKSCLSHGRHACL